MQEDKVDTNELKVKQIEDGLDNDEEWTKLYNSHWIINEIC